MYKHSSSAPSAVVERIALSNLFLSFLLFPNHLDVMFIDRSMGLGIERLSVTAFTYFQWFFFFSPFFIDQSSGAFLLAQLVSTVYVPWITVHLVIIFLFVGPLCLGRQPCWIERKTGWDRNGWLNRSEVIHIIKCSRSIPPQQLNGSYIFLKWLLSIPPRSHCGEIVGPLSIDSIVDHGFERWTATCSGKVPSSIGFLLESTLLK